MRTTHCCLAPRSRPFASDSHRFEPISAARSTVEFGERHFVRLSDDSMLAVGNYRFSRMQGGQEFVTPARFTFVVQRREGAWKVLHHHSSAEPG